IEVQLPGKQARHQDALCWEILVDRSDGDLGELRDLVHPEAENPMPRNQRIGRAQDVFAALATPRLLWNACTDANGRGWNHADSSSDYQALGRHTRTQSVTIPHPANPLTN